MKTLLVQMNFFGHIKQVTLLLSENMDSNIGMGVYDELCNQMDEMQKCEENGDRRGVEKAKANVKNILESYQKAKGDRNDEQDID